MLSTISHVGRGPLARYTTVFYIYSNSYVLEVVLTLLPDDIFSNLPTTDLAGVRGVRGGGEYTLCLYTKDAPLCRAVGAVDFKII